ncbi:hypothetical protein ACFYNO_07160 [Kitasatospora sp. NPDC006697]|uniref:hypothetical protein n=1 Tax=Kitasatospora sp. NPDC006697 TaxID=3364020 RepID=UPI0036BB15E7
MPPTAAMLSRSDSAATAGSGLPAARRRRRGLPHSTPEAVAAHAALQRALDRRDNGGATGH